MINHPEWLLRHWFTTGVDHEGGGIRPLLDRRAPRRRHEHQSSRPLLTRSRWSAITYWTATVIIVTESLVGGTFDLLRLSPFFPMLIELGYPAYLATILGIGMILAAITLTLPRLPRLKEWAYAGILINMLGAAASQIAVGNGPGDYVPPLMFAAIALTSWAYRPATRGLPTLAHDPSTAARIRILRDHQRSHDGRPE